MLRGAWELGRGPRGWGRLGSPGQGIEFQQLPLGCVGAGALASGARGSGPTAPHKPPWNQPQTHAELQSALEGGEPASGAHKPQRPGRSRPGGRTRDLAGAASCTAGWAEGQRPGGAAAGWRAKPRKGSRAKPSGAPAAPRSRWSPAQSTRRRRTRTRRLIKVTLRGHGSPACRLFRTNVC